MKKYIEFLNSLNICFPTDLVYVHVCVRTRVCVYVSNYSSIRFRSYTYYDDSKIPYFYLKTGREPFVSLRGEGQRVCSDNYTINTILDLNNEKNH